MFKVSQVHEKIKFDTSSLFNEPLDYKVIFYNDDITSFDFVIAILRSVYFKTYEEAHKITLEIHNKGKSIIDVYPKEIAEHKIQQTTKSARQHGFPLQVKIEPNSL